MIKRPKSTDTESDILKMQENYLKEKEKNVNFQPAAKFVRVEQKTTENNKIDGKKVSKFAQRRGHLTNNIQRPTESKISKASHSSNIVFGEIIEKTSNQSEIVLTSVDLDNGFPKVERIDKTKISLSSNKSIFAQNMEAKRNKSNETEIYNDNNLNLMECDDNIEVIEPNQFSKEIHLENLERLKNMNENEIINEQEQLLNALDPKMIEFLKSRKKNIPMKTNSVKSDASSADQNQANIKIPDIDFLKNDEIKNWLHFDVIEPAKLEWMQSIPENYPKIKPGEPFEARFDWKGFLLPYVENQNTEFNEDTRELYFHGDDVHRPGYTLQELFRLARSNVLQQRISALNCISGILNIYNQGYYDHVLELPITKIFFLLRYSLDENSISMLESSSKAMSAILYNDIDETLLDAIFESNFGFKQPFLFISNSSTGDSSLENKMSSLQIGDKQSISFKSNIDDKEMTDFASMNDFHLAETDLIECVLRTNILERIRYIVQTVKPDNTTIISCLKILIRIARDSQETIYKICTIENLLESLIEYFMPQISNYEKFSKTDLKIYHKPQYLLIKLLRILSLGGMEYGFKLKKMKGVEDILRSYVFLRDDINEDLVQMQIEAFRLIKIWAYYFRGDDFLRSIQSALRFFMEWHYQFLDFHQSGHFLIRQHAAALISLLENCTHSDFNQIFGQIFMLCFNKWYDLGLKTGNGIKEFSQSILLTACVQTSKLLLDTGDGNFKFMDKFSENNVLDKICKDLSQQSILLSSHTDRSQIHTPLFNLGSIVFPDPKHSQPELIIQQRYPFILLNALIEIFPHHFRNPNENLLKFFENFTNKKLNENLKFNWFTKFEIKFLINNLKLFNNLDISFKIAFKLLTCLTAVFETEIHYILDHFLFSSKLFGDAELGNCKIDYLNLLSETIQYTEADWRVVVIPSYWPYLPLFMLYQASQLPPNPNQMMNIDEGRLIVMTLYYTNYLESKIPNSFTPNDHLVSSMLPYFASEPKFMEYEIKDLLREKLKSLKNLEFDFDAKFMNDRLSFENLYISFLEQFQGMSYGDEIFSAFVMIPLQQKYNAKWRKIVWSEHVAVLRFITCTEMQLINGTMDDYLYPIETDVSLLNSYNQAIKTNILRKNSIPYQIAEFHLKNFTPKSIKKQNSD